MALFTKGKGSDAGFATWDADPNRPVIGSRHFPNGRKEHRVLRRRWHVQSFYQQKGTSMDDEREMRIRERAHEIWEREGRPEGAQEEHWRRASEEIDAENQGGSSAAESGVANPAQPGAAIPGGPTGASD
jgi:hypothetical protein